VGNVFAEEPVQEDIVDDSVIAETEAILEGLHSPIGLCINNICQMMTVKPKIEQHILNFPRAPVLAPVMKQVQPDGAGGVIRVRWISGEETIDRLGTSNAELVIVSSSASQVSMADWKQLPARRSPL
jgi:hypothetical protein